MVLLIRDSVATRVSDSLSRVAWTFTACDIDACIWHITILSVNLICGLQEDLR